jgi:hypothetical protein
MPRKTTTQATPAKATRKASKKTTQKAAKKTTRKKVPKKAPTDDPLGRLRKIIEGFPQTSEKISHGAPTWWGGKKTFATFHVDHHGDGRVAVWLKAPPGLQEALVEADPVRFFRPPYVGPSGWVGVRLEDDVDWGVVAGLLEEGYRSVAPKRALDELDAR